MIRNNVSAAMKAGQGNSESRSLRVADPVNKSEIVSAAVDSHGELRLNDDSLVIVGEDSSVALDDFVYQGGSSFSAGTVRVTKGAFRFITGNSPKGAFKVETPLSTIGVRGTVFDVYVDGASGNTKVVLLRGAVRVCSTGNRCVDAERACDIIEVRSPEVIGRIPFLRSAERSRSEEASQYTLSERQRRFSREWRAPTLACHGRAATEGPSGVGPGSNGGPGGEPTDNDGRGGDSPNY